MVKKLLLSLALLWLLLAVGPPPETARAQIDPDPLPPEILPPVWRLEGLRIAYQRVNVTIADQVATTHIDQLFINDNDWLLEGTYLFPLPRDAAVSQLTMWVDGVPIEAKILEREQARAIYDEIVRQLRDPALLEYVGTQAIQANVFPIPPHAERRLEIEYTHVLPAENGVIAYEFLQSTDLYTNTTLDNQSIRVDVRADEAIRAIYSPSHSVAITRDGDFHAIAGYEDARVIADQDFKLYYTVSPEDIGLNLLTYRESGQDGFFLLLVAPSIEADEVVAKDVILVLDTSGSMEGEKMAQAKTAARYVVEHLNPADRFNIIAFSTGVRRFAPSWQRAGDPGDYMSFINSLEALGGTNISQSLLEAVGVARSGPLSERPTTVIFLTDGLATEGITDTGLLLDAVQQATPANVRIFAFGVGDDVDTTLLGSLAQNHRGTTTYVRPFEAIDEAVSNFYAKVSTPVLADISLDFAGITVEQVYPQALPDLFAGTQLVLTGRYRDGGPSTITLRGTVNGRERVFTYPDNFFRMRSGEAFIPRLWATRAIGHLLTQIRLNGENPELVQSIVNLSIRYGIVTPYTSYLIEEDDIFSQAARQTIVEEEVAERAAAPTYSSGADAVAEAAFEAEMAAAEAPLELPLATRTTTEEGNVAGLAGAITDQVRLVGSKSFVWRDGLWTDTAYESDRNPAQQVNFASETYFELLSALPELGQYLALGPRVLVVHEGVAYEVVERGGQTSIELPEPDLVDAGSGTDGTDNGGEASTVALPITAQDTGGSDQLGGSSDRGIPAMWGLVLGALFVMGAALGVGVLIGRSRSRPS